MRCQPDVTFTSNKFHLLVFICPYKLLAQKPSGCENQLLDNQLFHIFIEHLLIFTAVLVLHHL